VVFFRDAEDSFIEPKVASQIFCAWFPVEDELVLFYLVADPVETHVHGPGFALFESVVGDACGCGVVCLAG
jgi:hypothetical protein